MKWIIETKRLGLRKITKDDSEKLAIFLKDIDVMYAWEHEFSDEEITEWVDKNLIRYEKDGFSYFIGIEKETKQIIGVIGPLVEEIDGQSYIGIAYIINKEFWGKGYAYEGAQACIEYVFRELNVDKVIAQIRPNNMASRKVAERLGMTIEGEYIKYYQDKEMPHLIYSIQNRNYRSFLD